MALLLEKSLDEIQEDKPRWWRRKASRRKMPVIAHWFRH